MKLIQARAGSLENAVEFVEGQRRLRELGIVDKAWDVIAEGVAGTPAREIIKAAQGKIGKRRKADLLTNEKDHDDDDDAS